MGLLLGRDSYSVRWCEPMLEGLATLMRLVNRKSLEEVTLVKNVWKDIPCGGKSWCEGHEAGRGLGCLGAGCHGMLSSTHYLRLRRREVDTLQVGAGQAVVAGGCLWVNLRVRRPEDSGGT